MAGQKAKGGKKNRKHGRNKARSQAMARYRAEARWERNKRRRIEANGAWLHACHVVREAAKAAGEKRPKDMGRRVRALRRAA